MISLLVDSLSPRRRFLRDMRAAWGHLGAKDEWLADRYFFLAKADDGLPHVDDRTWNDLEFPRIFRILDTTVTRLGSQYLFRQLRTYVDQPQELYESYQALRCDRALRERIQLILASLNADSAATIVGKLFEHRDEGLKYPRLTVCWSLASIALLFAIVFSLVPPALAVPILIINVAVIARTASQRYRLIETFRSMHRMVDVASRLARIRADDCIPQLAALTAQRDACARAQRAFRTFALLDTLPFGASTWLNLLCLAESIAYLYTADRMSGLRTELRKLYALVGSLDAAIAVASFLERSPNFCRPDIASDGKIEIESGYHPLIDGAVRNSLTLRERSALISGSNMAGKTTFIKMAGINVILGRTLGFCLATKATIPCASVMACIKSEHSVESGKSRYFAEIEAMLSFLRDDGCRSSLLVVIDEPFSGTNTAERIAAAKAVLGRLNQRSLVLATTHDVELQGLLCDRFDLYHFTENPDIEGFFDYQLRPGPCTEGNALRLLAKVGFPSSVINEAVKYITERTESTAEMSIKRK